MSSRFKLVPLRDLVGSIEAGRSYGGSAPPATDDQWGLIRVSAMTSGIFRPNENKAVPEVAADARYEIRPGDLLVSRANTTEYVGASVLVGAVRPRLLLSDKSLRLVLRDGIEPKWLHLMLSSPSVRTQISARATGTSDSMRNISQASLLSVEVPLLSILEQRRVIDMLEDHLSHLDAADHLCRASGARLVSLRRASLAAVVDTPERPRVPLSDLVRRVEAGRSFGGSSPPAAPDQWGIVKVSAMTWGEFRADQNKAIPDENVDARYEIKAGDLLISRANTTDYVGASVLVEDVRPRLLLSDKSLRVVPREGVNARWLQLALSTPAARSRISALATGTKESMRNISQANLMSVELPQATGSQQAADIAELSDWFQAIDRLGASVHAVARRSAALRRGLLAAAFSGGLTGQSSDVDRVELAAAGAAS